MTTDNWTPPRRGFQPRRKKVKAVADLVERLLMQAKALDKHATQLEAEIERLRAGFTRFVQDSNDCPVTGVFCRPECGCELEMKDWIQWTASRALEPKP